MAKVIVTGATGHIGRALLPDLLEAGHTVRALCLPGEAPPDGLPVERVEGDVRDRESLQRAFAGQEVLIHMAAIISLRPGDEALMRAVNVEGVENVARAALHCAVRRMVHVSSVHAFETLAIDGALTESAPPATAGAAPAYDKSKAEGEARLRAVIAEGLDATILNPVGVLGPFDHRPSILGRSLVAIGRSGPIIGAEGGFSWVDVRDVCAAIITAIDRGAPGENHLLSAGYCSSVGLCELAGRAAGRTGRAWRMPLWFLRLLLPLQPLIRLFSSSADGFSADAIYALRTRLRVDPSKAEQVLGFQARPIAESVADAMAWWRENGYLD